MGQTLLFSPFKDKETETLNSFPKVIQLASDGPRVPTGEPQMGETAVILWGRDFYL